MSKKRSKQRSSGVGRKSLRTLLIRVFEKHNSSELTHKEICQIVDARDPNSRQNVFDELNVYIAPKFFGQGIPLFKSKGDNKNKYNLRVDHVESVKNDIKIVYKREN